MKTLLKITALVAVAVLVAALVLYLMAISLTRL